MIHGRRHLLAIGFALLGFVYAIATLFAALLMTGAGHGWMSGAGCGYGIFILPLFGAALAYRDRRAGIALLSIALAGGMAVDYWLIQATEREGIDYLHKVQRALPLEYTVWQGMWLAWQIAILFLLPWSIWLNLRQRRETTNAPVN